MVQAVLCHERQGVTSHAQAPFKPDAYTDDCALILLLLLHMKRRGHIPRSSVQTQHPAQCCNSIGWWAVRSDLFHCDVSQGKLTSTPFEANEGNIDKSRYCCIPSGCSSASNLTLKAGTLQGSWCAQNTDACGCTHGTGPCPAPAK